MGNLTNLTVGRICDIS